MRYRIHLHYPTVPADLGGAEYIPGLEALLNQEGIPGVLVAVHSKFSSSDWGRYLLAVANV